MSLTISLALATTLAGPLDFLEAVGSVFNDQVKNVAGATITVMESTADAVGTVAEVGGEAVAKVSAVVVEDLASPDTLLELAIAPAGEVHLLSLALDALLTAAASDLVGTDLPSVPREHRRR